MDQSNGGNADQIAYWNALAGETWAELQERLDAQIQPLGARAMAALAPRPGEWLLDIGCGCGQTTAALAEAVGPSGGVLGLDISRPMLAVARRRLADAGAENARLLEADAQTERLEPNGFDAAFSRFGVMFFSDPRAAFANVRSSLKSGGRLAFVCWRALFENPWMLVPMAAALQHLPAPPPPLDPLAPGPFAFADPERVRAILTGAGFEGVEIAPHDQKIGTGDVDQATALALKVGPLGAHLTAEGVRMDSATWIVTARAP